MSLPVVEQNLHFLRQGADLLRRLDDETYQDPGSDRPRAAGMGPHFRHCLDLYRCFLRDRTTGRIDYDSRQRQTKIETSVLAALATIEGVIADLAALSDEDLERDVLVHHDELSGEEPATSWHRSTVTRELRFLASHTVHHYALIAHLARDRGIDVAPEFGVAPATLDYWVSQETS